MVESSVRILEALIGVLLLPPVNCFVSFMGASFVSSVGAFDLKLPTQLLWV